MTPTELPADKWFTEIHTHDQSAFSLSIREHAHSEKTPFQQIDIYETEAFGNLMTIDGYVMLTSRDNFLYHEMMTHPVLFSHPDPKNVAIIGGGDCGTLQAVLKHKTVEKAVQVEIDERVTALSMEYFPELCTHHNDNRATLLFEDGIQWMKNQPAESLDVVIVDSTDPVGPAEGLFNVPFYESVLRALKPGGLMVQQSESPLIHMSLHLAMHQAMLEANFYDTWPILFPQPVYPSGWWSALMASKDSPLPIRPQIREVPFKTDYYTTDIHRGAVSLPPFLQAAIASTKEACATHARIAR